MRTRERKLRKRLALSAEKRARVLNNIVLDTLYKARRRNSRPAAISAHDLDLLVQRIRPLLPAGADQDLREIVMEAIAASTRFSSSSVVRPGSHRRELWEGVYGSRRGR